MEPEETAAIVRYVKSLCPQQKIDQFTYEVWHDVIGELEFEQARNAVISVVHSQPFVSASDIITAARRRPHPSDRTVAEAVESANRRALGAAEPTPPTPGYLAAKDQLIARMQERDEQAYLADREAQRRAQAWIDYKIRGEQPVDLPLLAPAAPRWQPLPGDPPELRQWLGRQPAEADGPN